MSAQEIIGRYHNAIAEERFQCQMIQLKSDIQQMIYTDISDEDIAGIREDFSTETINNGFIVFGKKEYQEDRT